MNSFKIASIAGLFALSFTANANSATLADMLAESATAQLAELSISIKQQAKAALENTAAELLFSIGNDSAAQTVGASAEIKTSHTMIAATTEKQ